MENKIKCPECGISVPDVPENATQDELLCNSCYDKLEEHNINFNAPSTEG